ncbi:MAG: hypothetical protein Ct9H300mP25_13910 [Acidobacteriota bacterium]|nr:MAG: hypothetical protein Ct9H300mP25_13910 [Acidobacteriota bacterium]
MITQTSTISIRGNNSEYGRCIFRIGGSPLNALDLTVPGDPSSAAFWIAAASIIPDSDILLEGVGLNPTRTAYIDVLRRAGADIRIELTALMPRNHMERFVFVHAPQ